MKLLVSALMLLSAPSFAVVVKKCPQTLTVEIPKVKIFSKRFVESQTKDLDQSKIDFNSIDNFLYGMFTEFSFEGELVDTKNSKCVYESTEDIAQFRYVRIAGSDKKAYLVMEFEDYRSETMLSFFASPSAKTPMYDFSGATAQIKAEAWGESWGDSYLINIPVGKGVIK
jgi:hypothetical protein